MEDDLVGWTRGLSAQDLIEGYKRGFFPWPCGGTGELMPWFCPDPRGLVFFNEFHVPRSFAKWKRKNSFDVTFCKNFNEVIEECAKQSRPDQEGTWITPSIIKAYTELFDLNQAYSVEVWHQEQLVGGLYGVVSQKYISAESMFYKTSGASKLALWAVVQKAKSLEVSFLDTQMISPVVQAFGGRTISKKEFLKTLNQSRMLDDTFYERLSQ